MWCPDDESLCTRNREITLHSSDQDDTISSIPTTLSQSSALTIFPVKRAASNEFGEDVVDRKVRRLDRDGINSVISPFLGYVDLMNNERNKSSVCGYHIQVQNELKEHPQIIHCDDIVDGMAMGENADDSCHSEMDIQATFDATSPSKVDAELCSREKIRATTSIHQIIRQVSYLLLNNDRYQRFKLSGMNLSLLLIMM
ncbi:hypothetical protein PRIPAC_76912 [Pristionchus pacificus]|nr:hypothetical protein PRIPAC_76912 [Pristionchus pacificus]